MPTPEEKTRETKLHETKLEVLRAGLEQNHKMLMDAGALPLGQQPDWNGLAEGLLRTPQLWNNKPLADCPNKLKELISTKLVRVDAIAKHISDATEEQEAKGVSWGQIGRGLMQNPLGFFGAFIQGIMAFFSAIFSGKSMEESFAGFKDAFKPIVAPAVADDVGSSIYNRIAHDPVALGRNNAGNPPRLTATENEQLELIAGTVGNKILDANGAQKRPFAPSLHNNGNSDEIHNSYRNAVLASFGLKDGVKRQIESTDIVVGNTSTSSLTSLQMVCPEQFDINTEDGKKHLAALTNTLADVMKEAATDGQKRSPEQVKDLIEEKLKRQMTEIGFADNEQDKKIIHYIANKTTIEYLSERLVDKGTEETKKFVKNAEAENNKTKTEIMANMLGNAFSMVGNKIAETDIAKGILNTGTKIIDPLVDTTQAIVGAGERIINNIQAAQAGKKLYDAGTGIATEIINYLPFNKPASKNPQLP